MIDFFLSTGIFTRLRSGTLFPIAQSFNKFEFFPIMSTEYHIPCRISSINVTVKFSLTNQTKISTPPSFPLPLGLGHPKLPYNISRVEWYIPKK